MKMKLVVGAVALAAAFNVHARSENVTVWRGETRTLILSDFAKVGVAPAGLDVKVGTAKEIRYLDRPFGTHYRTMAARVAWGSSDPGVKVVSVTAAAGLKPGVYPVGGLDAVLEPDGLLWYPPRKCLVGATTPIARCMEILRERIGLTPDECRAIGHDNALALLNM